MRECLEYDLPAQGTIITAILRHTVSTDETLVSELAFRAVVAAKTDFEYPLGKPHRWGVFAKLVYWRLFDEMAETVDAKTAALNDVRRGFWP